MDALRAVVCLPAFGSGRSSALSAEGCLSSESAQALQSGRKVVMGESRSVAGGCHGGHEGWAQTAVEGVVGAWMGALHAGGGMCRSPGKVRWRTPLGYAPRGRGIKSGEGVLQDQNWVLLLDSALHSVSLMECLLCARHCPEADGEETCGPERGEEDFPEGLVQAETPSVALRHPHTAAPGSRPCSSSATVSTASSTFPIMAGATCGGILLQRQLPPPELPTPSVTFVPSKSPGGGVITDSPFTGEERRTSLELLRAGDLSLSRQ